MQGMSRNDQFDLFGEPIPAPIAGDAKPSEKKSSKATRVEPAAVDAAITDLAARLSARVRLGTSSWSFPGWANLVYASTYPDTALARHGLPAYAAHPLLHTVGIDRTFYAPISEADFRTYATQARAVSQRFAFWLRRPCC